MCVPLDISFSISDFLLPKSAIPQLSNSTSTAPIHRSMSVVLKAGSLGFLRPACCCCCCCCWCCCCCCPCCCICWAAACRNCCCCCSCCCCWCCCCCPCCCICWAASCRNCSCCHWCCCCCAISCIMLPNVSFSREKTDPASCWSVSCEKMAFSADEAVEAASDVMASSKFSLFCGVPGLCSWPS